jgi:hypothetical protein
VTTSNISVNTNWTQIIFNLWSSYIPFWNNHTLNAQIYGNDSYRKADNDTFNSIYDLSGLTSIEADSRMLFASDGNGTNGVTANATLTKHDNSANCSMNFTGGILVWNSC